MGDEYILRYITNTLNGNKLHKKFLIMFKNLRWDPYQVFWKKITEKSNFSDLKPIASTVRSEDVKPCLIVIVHSSIEIPHDDNFASMKYFEITKWR